MSYIGAVNTSLECLGFGRNVWAFVMLDGCLLMLLSWLLCQSAGARLSPHQHFFSFDFFFIFYCDPLLFKYTLIKVVSYSICPLVVPFVYVKLYK